MEVAPTRQVEEVEVLVGFVDIMSTKRYVTGSYIEIVKAMSRAEARSNVTVGSNE